MLREHNRCTAEIYYCNVSEVLKNNVPIKKDGMFKGRNILQGLYTKIQCYVNVIPDIIFT